MALSRLAALRSSPMARHLSVSAPAASKAVDPIQKLFLDKLKEYDTKKQWVTSEHVIRYFSFPPKQTFTETNLLSFTYSD